MKLIHFGGIRLGAAYPEWPAQADRIRRSLKQMLIQLFERARETHADALVSAGEMFDSNTVAPADVEVVTELCSAYPEIAMILVPGLRDAWGPQSVYHHLLGQAPANVHVVSPTTSQPVTVGDGLRVYAITRDASSETLPSLSDAVRSDDPGVHVAVVCSDLGRSRPGPEAGMVMVSPRVTQHRFDYLALGDGGAAEVVGHGRNPACYAGTPSVHTGKGDTGAVAWQLDFASTPAAPQKLDLKGIVRRECALDISTLPDAQAVADRILAMGDESTLISAVLTGTRAADRPVLEQEIMRICRERLLGLHILDATELAAPATLRTDRPTLAMLWARYQQAPANERGVWADALRLYTSGVTDPEQWTEAPWAR